MILDLSSAGLFVETDLLPYALGESVSSDSARNDLASAVVASAFNGRVRVPVRACIDQIVVPTFRAYDAQLGKHRGYVPRNEMDREMLTWLATGGESEDGQRDTIALFVLYWALARMSHALSNSVFAAVAGEIGDVVTTPQKGYVVHDFGGEIWKAYKPSDVIRRILDEPQPGPLAATLMRNAVSRRDPVVGEKDIPGQGSSHYKVSDYSQTPPWLKPSE